MASAGLPVTRGSALVGLVRATHPLPTVAVTTLVSGTAWGVGWRGAGLVGVAITVLVGQASVGWSNDAVDARVDRRSARLEKPTVAGLVSAQTLWRSAITALTVSIVLSWVVAGWAGGTFHVLALALAWLYNLGLSRTSWSWLPYAVSFGCVAPFLTLGLDWSLPPLWLVVVYPVIAVAAHLANALPDIDIDRAAGLGGAAVRLGPRGTRVLTWLLLATGSVILGLVLAAQAALLAVAVVAAYAVCLALDLASSSPERTFRLLLATAAVDLLAVVGASVLSG